MDKQLVINLINDILDDWDPIGANHFQGMRGNEYIRYAPRLVQNYLQGRPTYESLNELQIELIDNSSPEMMEATHNAAHAFDEVLSNCDRTELQWLFGFVSPDNSDL